MKETEKKPSKFKRLHMGFIILIAIGSVLLLTTAYSMIESACVHSGKDMPYQRDVWGGVCYEEVGIFWSVFHLEPMTSIDDPAPAYAPEINFRLKNFLTINICGAFALWVILSLINRYFKPVIIVVGSLVTVYLVIFAVKKIKKAWEDTPVELTSITVVTCDVHPGIYSTMFYPHNAYRLVPPGGDEEYGYSAREYMDTNKIKMPADIKGKELRKLIDVAKQVKENTDRDYKKDFVYKVVVVYKTKSGYDSVRAVGYGDFPECWPEFIRAVNETCGLDYLRENPEPVTFSAEWFSETYGIYDDDLAGDVTVEDYLELSKINMERASCMNSSGDTFDFEPGKYVKAFNEQYEKEQNEKEHE